MCETYEVHVGQREAGDKTGKVFLVVWLGKRGRDCQKSSGSKTGRSVLCDNIVKSATRRQIFELCAFFAEKPRPHFLTVSYSLGLGAAPSSSSGLRRLTLHFNILLDGELGEGLLDAQGRETGGSVRVPALPHDFADDPQSLKCDAENEQNGSHDDHTSSY